MLCEASSLSLLIRGVRGLVLEMILKYLLEKAEMMVQAHAVSRKNQE